VRARGRVLPERSPHGGTNDFFTDRNALGHAGPSDFA
jgi:hypothetical protein